MTTPPRRGDPFEREVRERTRQLRVGEAARARLQAEKAGARPFTDRPWDEVEEESAIPFGPDEVCLAHGIHWVSGDYGSGKSILAYWVARMRARAGQHSAILEAEMGQARVKGLMRELGATEAEMLCIHYLETDSVPDLIINGPALHTMLTDLGAGMLILDSAVAFLSAAGKNENVASEVREWVNAACRPAAGNGRLVFIIDHLNHQGGIRGSTDKPAAGDVILKHKCTKQFSRGVSGAIQLTCDKDRSGTLTGSTIDIAVNAEEDGSFQLEPGKWENITEQARKGFQDATRQRDIKLVLQKAGRPMKPEEIAEVIGSTSGLPSAPKPDTIRSALRRGRPDVFSLVGDGFWSLSGLPTKTRPVGRPAGRRSTGRGSIRSKTRPGPTGPTNSGDRGLPEGDKE
jgi:hypothetical protein